MNGTHRFRVECHVVVTEDDVWDFIECVENGDVKEMQENGYELTEEDYMNTAKNLFCNDIFIYDDFREER